MKKLLVVFFAISCFMFFSGFVTVESDLNDHIEYFDDTMQSISNTSNFLVSSTRFIMSSFENLYKGIISIFDFNPATELPEGAGGGFGGGGGHSR